MRTSVSSVLAGLAFVLASGVGAGRAGADATPSLGFEPTPAGDRSFGVERARVRGHLLISGRAALDWARDPLVLMSAEQEPDRVIASQLWLHNLVSLSLWHRLVIHADMPFVLQQQGGPVLDRSATAPRQGEHAEVGDLRLGARVVLIGTADDAPMRVDLALSAAVWLPTASEGYAGDGAPRGRASLIAAGDSKHVYWAFNATARSRPRVQLRSVLPTRVGPALGLGAAGGFYLGSRRDLAVGVETVIELGLGGGARMFDPRATVGQTLLTGHWRVMGLPVEIGAAFGPGFGEGAGAADVRVIGMVGYAPETPPPPPDRDKDGVPDKIDACVDIAGVPSRDPLLHGCPEAPPDRDGDGIPDVHDACPRVPGEATGVRATHGCPRPPPEIEGERPAPEATLVERQIVISQQVQFETGTAVLRSESDGVLGKVAKVLADHPEITLIEVQGHTDDTGTPERNRALGQERAESVRAWLVAHGVADARLRAKGYGADQPIAHNTTDEGRALNRRVEFRVIEPAAPPPDGESK